MLPCESSGVAPADGARVLRAMQAFGRDSRIFRTDIEAAQSFCEALCSYGGYRSAVVGRNVGNGPWDVIRVAGSGGEHSAGTRIDLGWCEADRVLESERGNPFILCTDVRRSSAEHDGSAPENDSGSVLAVSFAVHGAPWGVLVVDSCDPSSFDTHERASIEQGVVHLSTTLESLLQENIAHESERKYRDLVENMSEIVYAISRDGELAYVSPSVERVLGFPPDALLGRQYERLLPAEDWATAVEDYRRQRSGEMRDVRLRVRDAQDRVHVLRAAIVPPENDSGEVVGIATDVTEKELAEQRLLAAFEGTIKALGELTVARDPYTAGHQVRVAGLACSIAERMGLDQERVRVLRYAGLVHDIGKMSVPAEILAKPAALAETEVALVRSHSLVAHRILTKIGLPWPIAEIVYQHHERLDGSGYPRGLTGSDIMLEARILALADVVEAMCSHRPYRPARGVAAARAEITSRAGMLYDPDAVSACVEILAEGRFPVAESGAGAPVYGAPTPF